MEENRVKIGIDTSEWADILKGVPQCSILGPILLNIFLNDLFKFIKKAELITCVNYPDDNTIIATESLQIESKAAMNWFTLNEMLANPHKFQAIFLASADM